MLRDQAHICAAIEVDASRSFFHNAFGVAAGQSWYHKTQLSSTKVNSTTVFHSRGLARAGRFKIFLLYKPVCSIQPSNHPTNKNLFVRLVTEIGSMSKDDHLCCNLTLDQLAISQRLIYQVFGCAWKGRKSRHRRRNF